MDFIRIINILFQRIARPFVRWTGHLGHKILDCTHIRFIILNNEMLDENRLNTMEMDEDFNSVVKDLRLFTGLSEKQIRDRLLRKPRWHFKNEFKWHSPSNRAELLWFYRCSYGYLFANAAHPYWNKLDFLTPEMGRILDYGGGVGNNAIALAKRRCDVDYFEVNCIQESFVRFRASRLGLKNIYFISPFVKGKHDPIGCINRTYGAIILQDVLEHIPDYHILLHHLIQHLNSGGYIIEVSPFSSTAREIDIHLKPSMNLIEAMKGMTHIDEGVWRKI